MTDPNIFDETCGTACYAQDMGRREFGALVLGAGVAVAAGSAQGAALAVKTEEVTIKTPDGLCDAVLTHPGSGAFPGVLIWPDAMGLRPAFRDMATRLAAEGYAVLVPNPFYRTAKAPVFGPDFDFNKPEDRAKLPALMGPLQMIGAAERDTTAFISFLDSNAAVRKSSKIGTNGYCMGGPLTMRTAATAPDRIGAAGSFHGGSLVTDKPESPHLLIPRIKAKYVFAVAENDDKAQPDAKTVLKASFEAVKNPADIEVYTGAMHGWCVPGGQVYNQALAERAWTKLLALYKKELG